MSVHTATIYRVKKKKTENSIMSKIETRKKQITAAAAVTDTAIDADK